MNGVTVTDIVSRKYMTQTACPRSPVAPFLVGIELFSSDSANMIEITGMPMTNLGRKVDQKVTHA